MKNQCEKAVGFHWKLPCGFGSDFVCLFVKDQIALFKLKQIEGRDVLCVFIITCGRDQV